MKRVSLEKRDAWKVSILHHTPARVTATTPQTRHARPFHALPSLSSRALHHTPCPILRPLNALPPFAPVPDTSHRPQTPRGTTHTCAKSLPFQLTPPEISSIIPVFCDSGESLPDVPLQRDHVPSALYVSTGDCVRTA
eukprot:2985332-Rhodomonas_salina.1